MPRITVAIPARNRLHYLSRALDSVRAQSFTDFEVIISDNASSDDLQSLVDSYADARISLVRHSTDIGMARNWHSSLHSGSAPLVAWLHDDDYWEPFHLERAVEAFDRWTEASLYTTAVRHFYESSPEEVQRPPGLVNISTPVLLPPAAALRHWLQKHNAQCSCLVLRRSALEGVEWGPLGLLRQLDYFLSAQLVLAGGWIYNPEVLVNYRAHELSDNRRVEQSAALSVEKAQSIYIQRRICEIAFSRGFWNESQITASAQFWTPEQRLGLVLALASIFSSSPLRAASRKLAQDLKPDPAWCLRSGQARLFRLWGGWYASFAELIGFVRQRWIPRGCQIPGLNS